MSLTAPPKKSSAKGPRSWRKPAIIVGVLSGLGAGQWLGLDYYLTTSFSQRHDAYRAQLQGTTYHVVELQDLPLEYRARQLYRISSMESQFNRLTQKFVEYIKSSPQKAIEITRDYAEHSGVIEFDGTFRLKESNEWYVTLRNDVREIARGDFQHKQRLLETMQQYPVLSPEERNAIPLMLAAMEYDAKNSTTSQEANERGYFAIVGSDGQPHPIKTDEFHQLVKVGKEYFPALAPTLDYISPQVADEAFLSNSHIFARFHTHPKDDPNYQPSPPDEAHTHVMGPSVLLSQREGILHVYTMQHGKTKEIHTQRITQ